MGDFWGKKKVLITGADGFMGSHLAERLVEEKADVSVFVRASSVVGTIKHDLKNISHLKDKVKIISGNLASPESQKLIRRSNPQVIFHLAAEAYVPRSFLQPIEVNEANVNGTLNVLEAARELKEVEQVVCTSSSEIYGSAQYSPMDESHPLNPSSPYAASKVAADRYCYAYWNTYRLPVAIIRPFNTFGPRLVYDVIPKFIRQALRNENITIWGSGEQTRDFTYVDDMINAFLIMGSERKAVGQAVNFGTGKDISIKSIAEKIVRLTKTRAKIVYEKERPSEVSRLICSPARAKKLFGWEAKVGVDEGLKRTIDWTLKNKAFLK